MLQAVCFTKVVPVLRRAPCIVPHAYRQKLLILRGFAAAPAKTAYNEAKRLKAPPRRSVKQKVISSSITLGKDTEAESSLDNKVVKWRWAKPAVYTDPLTDDQVRQIPDGAWQVMRRLHKAGFPSYLAGGSVRDLLLEKQPKDFDIISTASPRQVRNMFSSALVVGKRFPICLVNIKGTQYEVSSFTTVPVIADKHGAKASREIEAAEAAENVRGEALNKWKSTIDEGHMAVADNALKRDFTVNGLLYEPFERKLYDFVGGMKDLKAKKVRTILPPEESFQEDPARLLRAIRVAGRMGFAMEAQTGRCIENMRLEILRLPQSRYQWELNIMMSYGAASTTIRLLWRYKLLDLLLPLPATYMSQLRYARRTAKSDLLFDLMAALDAEVTTDNPCNAAVWVSLIGIHLASQQLKTPPEVLLAVGRAAGNGRGLKRAARQVVSDQNRPSEDAESAENASQSAKLKAEEISKASWKLVKMAAKQVERLSSPELNAHLARSLADCDRVAPQTAISRPTADMATRLLQRIAEPPNTEHSTKQNGAFLSEPSFDNGRTSALSEMGALLCRTLEVCASKGDSR